MIFHAQDDSALRLETHKPRSLPTLPMVSNSTLRARRSLPTLDCSVVKACTALLEDPARPGACAGIADKYDIVERLGKGRSARVYRAKSRMDGREVALKCVETRDETFLHIAKQEYELLHSLQHPNIIGVVDLCLGPAMAALAMEFFPGSTLAAAVACAPASKLEERQAIAPFRQLVDAVSYLHAHDIIHRDVKGENALVSGDLSDLRLVDFNTAKHAVEGELLSAQGTHRYQPPEVLCGEPSDKGGDVWACGVCLHLMLQGHLPFEAMFGSCSNVGRRIVECGMEARGLKWAHISDSCKNVLHRCLEVEPEKREQARVVLECPWVRGGEQAAAGGTRHATFQVEHSGLSHSRCDSSPSSQLTGNDMAKSRFRVFAVATCSTLGEMSSHDVERALAKYKSEESDDEDGASVDSDAEESCAVSRARRASSADLG